MEFLHKEWNGISWICKLKPGLILSLMDVTPMREINYKIEAKEDYLKFAFFLSGKGEFRHIVEEVHSRRILSPGSY